MPDSHPHYSECPDQDCDRYGCTAYREGYAAGTAAGSAAATAVA